MSPIKVILCKAWRILSVIATPFLKKEENVKALQEFADLVLNHYKSLVDKLEQVINDYFELSCKIKEMHQEVCTLREELSAAVAKSCKEAPGCKYAVK